MLGCWSDLGLFVVVGEDAGVEVARPKPVVWLFSYKSAAASLLSGRSLSMDKTHNGGYNSCSNSYGNSCVVEGGGKFQ